MLKIFNCHWIRWKLSLFFFWHRILCTLHFCSMKTKFSVHWCIQHNSMFDFVLFGNIIFNFCRMSWNLHTKNIPHRIKIWFMQRNIWFVCGSAISCDYRFHDEHLHSISKFIAAKSIQTDNPPNHEASSVQNFHADKCIREEPPSGSLLKRTDSYLLKENEMKINKHWEMFGKMRKYVSKKQKFLKHINLKLLQRKNSCFHIGTNKTIECAAWCCILK